MGYYGAPTAIRYNWLIDDGAGNLALGPAVAVATPNGIYNTGSGSVSGIECCATCSVTLDAGVTATLSAAPAAYFK